MRAALMLLSAAILLAACGGRKDEVETAPPLYTDPGAVPAFDARRAWQLLVAQTDFGPRNPGSLGQERCFAFLRERLAATADTLAVQEFRLPGYDGDTVRGRNLIARFRPGARRRILFAAHWDTRPRADRETDSARRAQPIAGANDGASGVAVLLHLAELLHARAPQAGVDIVLFDAEDYGREGDDGMYCLGARYFAATVDPAYKPLYGVLLDLVGDREAEFPREGSSEQYAPTVLDLVWSVASECGARQFSARRHPGIFDDHIPLNLTAGIPTVDIIDADLVGHAAQSERRKYWHTLRDTPDNCAPEPLGAVGAVLVRLAYGLPK
jgi:hypothetical protein